MIDVPEEVKELCKQDSVSKNFRIVFPNGEYRDLTNADMVAESVIFTESIGSTNGLRFGLCEGATLEFQTSFNANIRNKQIQAFIEVDVTGAPGSTSDEFRFEQQGERIIREYYNPPYNGDYNIYFDIPYRMDLIFRNSEEIISYTVSPHSTILLENVTTEDILEFRTTGHSSGEGDYRMLFTITNVPGIIPEWAQTSDDVPFPFYRIPYGIFYVNSCKRDGSSNIRKVVAYQNKWEVTGVGAIVNLSPFEKVKLITPVSPSSGANTDYVLDTVKFLVDNTQNIDMLGLFDVSPTVSTITNYDVIDNTRVRGHFRTLTELPYNQIGVRITTSFHGLNICNSAYNYTTLDYKQTDFKSLYMVSPYVRKTAEDLVTTMFQETTFIEYLYEIYPEIETVEELKVEILNLVKQALVNIADVNPYIGGWLFNENWCADYEYGAPFVVYPYLTNFFENTSSNYKKNLVTMGYPKDIKFQIVSGTFSEQVEYEKTISDLCTASISKYSFDSDLTSTYKRTIYSKPWYWAENLYNDPSVFEFNSLIGDIAELNGKFVRLDRTTNLIEYIDLSVETDICEITKNLWKTIWYEDKSSALYDKVVCNFKNSDDEEVSKSVDIIDTSSPDYESNLYQHYDISNNYYIKNKLISETKIDEIMQRLAYLIQNTPYYIMDVDMRGLPYLEAGDAIGLQTDSDEFTTIAMRRRISGIHALMDTIEIR